MSDAIVYVLLGVLSLVVLDALVLAGVVLARTVRARRARALRRTAPVALGTVLYAVPARQEPAAALAALVATGYPCVVDPLDDHQLLISCPPGPEHRTEVRSVLTREARRLSRTPGLGLPGPVRFADEV